MDGLGRYCNDEHRKPNAVMKKIEAADTVALCLFALRDIDEGVEVRYDYGPDIGSKMWWRYGDRSD